MKNVLNNIISFLNYWYFRYLLATELYMVEKWERVMIHVVFVIIFSLVSLFNSFVVLRLVSAMTGSFTANKGWEEIDPNFLADSVL